MQDVEQKAFEIYEKNISFFSQKYPHILKKIQTFQSAVEINPSIAQYDLEYLDGYFDVKQKSSGNYLYANNSIEVSKLLAKQVNFQKDSYIFEGFPIYYGVEKKENLDDKTRSLEGIYPLMSYYIDNTSSSDTMKMIEKFIFVGVGLGLHLIEIDTKISANEYFIIEDDLELFTLSLFCTPYYTFEQKQLYFSIGDDENSFMSLFNEFLETSFYLNRYLKYSHFPAHSKHKLKLIQNALASQDFISFPYKTLLFKYLRPFEYLDKGYNIIDLSHHFPKSSLSKKPMMVLGSGPSLEKNIEWLKQYHHHFVIMAPSSTLKSLYKYGIKPDIVTHLDGFESVLKVFEGFDVTSFVKEDTVFLCGSFIPTKVREMFAKENCFITEEDTFYHKNINGIVGPCVGSTSIFDALLLSMEEIYLLGLDFAIDIETGKTHSLEHVTKNQLDVEEKDKLQQVISFRKNLFPVKGNFVSKVYTNSLFQISLQTLYEKIPLIKQEEQTLYNLNDGAKIHQAIPKHIQEIDITAYKKLDHKKIFQEIKPLLEAKSEKYLSKEDIVSLKNRLQFAYEIKEILEDYKKSVSYKNSDAYLYDLLGLVTHLLKNKTYSKRETSNLTRVYYMFFKYTIPMIMDFFNTKSLKNEKHHIKKIDKILLHELFNIQKIYASKIEEFLAKY
ncbi:hypothetical protein MNB_SM-3-892 [hydrothermal vent metagenome]|uniref:Motility accessory factor n=1 Tax=hydrothermal vent metagenome TaxID=652676 RepID=A0A1W1D6A9_9ZZZZ